MFFILFGKILLNTDIISCSFVSLEVLVIVFTLLHLLDLFNKILAYLGY